MIVAENGRLVDADHFLGDIVEDEDLAVLEQDQTYVSLVVEQFISDYYLYDRFLI